MPEPIDARGVTIDPGDTADNRQCDGYTGWETRGGVYARWTCYDRSHGHG